MRAGSLGGCCGHRDCSVVPDGSGARRRSRSRRGRLPRAPWRSSRRVPPRRTPRRPPTPRATPPPPGVALDAGQGRGHRRGGRRPGRRRKAAQTNDPANIAAAAAASAAQAAAQQELRRQVRPPPRPPRPPRTAADQRRPRGRVVRQPEQGHRTEGTSTRRSRPTPTRSAGQLRCTATTSRSSATSAALLDDHGRQVLPGVQPDQVPGLLVAELRPYENLGYDFMVANGTGGLSRLVAEGPGAPAVHLAGHRRPQLAAGLATTAGRSSGRART